MMDWAVKVEIQVPKERAQYPDTAREYVRNYLQQLMDRKLITHYHFLSVVEVVD
jgi:hypothetical protein